MSSKFPTLVLICVLGLTTGCNREPKPIDPPVGWKDENGSEDEQAGLSLQRELEERDIEIIRFVLTLGGQSQVDGAMIEGINFLTATPREYWGTRGQWETLPAAFHASLDSLPTKYRPADEARLSAGYVLEKESNVRATMHWITIKRWISPNEVEVETGSWGGPLDAFGATTIYEKQDGQWKMKTVVESWLS